MKKFVTLIDEWKPSIFSKEVHNMFGNTFTFNQCLLSLSPYQLILLIVHTFYLQNTITTCRVLLLLNHTNTTATTPWTPTYTKPNVFQPVQYPLLSYRVPQKEHGSLIYVIFAILKKNMVVNTPGPFLSCKNPIWASSPDESKTWYLCYFGYIFAAKCTRRGNFLDVLGVIWHT